MLIQVGKQRIAHLKDIYRSLSNEKEIVLSFLKDVGSAFTSAIDLDQLLQRIVDSSKSIINSRSKAIFLLNEEKTHLHARIVDGIIPPIFGSIPDDLISKVATKKKYIQELVAKQTIPIGEGLLGEVITNNQPVLIEEGLQDDRIKQPPVDFLQANTLMIVPLVLRDEVIGAMVAVNTNNNKAFTETDLSLFKSLADQAAFCIFSARQYRLLADKERLDRELEIAAEVQNLILPRSFPKIHGYEIAGMNQPALEMGGDYYDFFPIGNQLYGIAMADVSGKGMPASLIMTMARSILRTLAPGETSPRAVLGELNRLLYPDIRQDTFISLIYTILDTRKNNITICRAGHEPIFYYDYSESSVRRLKPQGIVLGMDVGPLFISTMEEMTMNLDEGDIIVLYTDGVTQATDEEYEEFGYDNLEEVLRTSARLSAKMITENIKERVIRFTQGVPQRDDITLTVLKRNLEKYCSS